MRVGLLSVHRLADPAERNRRHGHGIRHIISGGTPMKDAPTRFTIRPDDYHVPYAGELFSGASAWVGLFLWQADLVARKRAGPSLGSVRRLTHAGPCPVTGWMWPL